MDDLQGYLSGDTIAPPATEFLPPERAPEEELRAQVDFFGKITDLGTFVDAVPDIYLVLNEERQIVFINERMREWIKCDGIDDVAGLRPGEALNCIHADETAGGCGTTEFCTTCGAALAIVSSQRGNRDLRECRIRLKDGGALDLRVWTTPTDIEGTRFTIFSVHDIADEKRRRVLERIFFHDILNTAGVLRGVSELLASTSTEDLPELHDLIASVTVKLVDEIQAQRDIMAAESGELSVENDILYAKAFLESIVGIYCAHPVAENRKIVVDESSANAAVIVDKRLLGRVIGNMIKNALEAIPPGEAVTVGSTADTDTMTFWVTNPTTMPKNVQLQVFQRSFSTKGEGRGLGTYSIKLLTERYLHGKVWFTTGDTGTTFFVQIPLQQAV